MSPVPPARSLTHVIVATAVVAVGTLLASAFLQTCLSSKSLSGNFISPTTVLRLSQPASTTGGGADPNALNIPFSVTFVPSLVVGLITWLSGAVILARRRGWPWGDALVCWGWYGWLWWCLIDVWEWVWIIVSASGWSSFASLLSAVPQFWLAGCLAAWLTTFLTLASWPRTISVQNEKPFRIRWLWLACGLYFVVFTAMNWRLYFNLLLPHGDSAMYEEHLWNLLHGKGFRSYLDRGLFLGEHIQFVHLFLIPLYVVWPSELMLEACSSAALALGAFPVFWMTRRHTGSDRAALAMAVAYLLYAPMQFLDIEIDLKTFRPESFGIPLLLLTLDQLDRGNLIGTLVGIGLCLTVKEDYTLIFGPLGIWIACSRRTYSGSEPTIADRNSRLTDRKSRVVFGLLLSAGSVFYLWLATRVLMPWLRAGAEVHYASYFSKFGKSPEEIVRTMLGKPGMLIESLVTAETALYAIALLAPLAFLPLLSPGRLAVGMPLFAILCLNELEGSRSPQHQFHAPLVAIAFWALAAALPRAVQMAQVAATRFQREATNNATINTVLFARLVWTSSLMTGMFFSLSPIGISFWDPGSSWYWARLYGPNHRAEMFARIAALIPMSARVASTDFVHPRYTHFERSYDYSEYQRKVSGEGKRVPDDTDYLVIDTDHRYSKIKKPGDVPELREHPDEWELLPDVTEGYFIVLKRKTKDAG